MYDFRFKKGNRNGDPEAFSCLTDEQREQVVDWFNYINSENHTQESLNSKDEGEAFLFAAFPYALWHSYRYTGGILNLKFLIDSVIGTISFYILFYFFYRIYFDQHINLHYETRFDRIWHRISVYGLTFLVLIGIFHKIFT